MEDLIVIFGVLALSGALAGFLAGLLGIGGGIVMVPVLYLTFQYLGVGETWLMHQAVATSLGIIIPTAFFSARAHNKAGAIVKEIIRPWTPWIIFGAVFGALVASSLGSGQLVLFFAVIAILMGVKLLLPLEGKVISDKLPGKVMGGIIAAFIGSASALMGIGGATLSVPTMTLFGIPIKKAIGTASLIGLIIAIPATIGYVWQGFGEADVLPYSLGFVNLVGVLVVAPVSSVMAPFGARTAHRLSRRTLSVLFGLFLIAAALRMAYPMLGI